MTLDHAEKSLSRFGHSHMSVAHLILGLLSLGNGIPYNVLTSSGLSIQSVENYLSSRHPSAEDITIREGVAVGASALSALSRAEAKARAQEFTYLRIDHLMLGILAEESGDAADLFASVHIDRENLRHHREGTLPMNIMMTKLRKDQCMTTR